MDGRVVSHCSASCNFVRENSHLAERCFIRGCRVQWRRSPLRRNVHQYSSGFILAKGGLDQLAYKSEKVKRQKFKEFDEAFITVRSGDGGNGEVAHHGSGKWVDNFKYRPGSNLTKRIWLSAADPADGADGASVILYVDTAVDSLLPLHERTTYNAKNGAHGNPALGSSGPRSRQKQRVSSPPLRIAVPPGTTVRRKRGGHLLGELIKPGQQLVVARGGRGGIGVKAPKREDNIRRRKMIEYDEGIVEDNNWKLDAKGAPGEQISLHLTLRVVADVGLVGFPNAGKSSLLRALTRARPDVAPYPFTTLTPNLGVLQPEDTDDYMVDPGQQAVLADLPGLIEGAHMGRGLGRNFLRHLRRTQVILHVVDAAAADPVTDYLAVREELRMYNPDYCAKPHVVALNKMDLEDAAELAQEILQDVVDTAHKLRAENDDGPTLPSSVVCCSAMDGQGLDELREAIERALESCGGPTAYATNPEQPDSY